jgi:beta-barrel assembly-enhancing protease
MNTVQATFFDGETARDHDVTLFVDGVQLTFQGKGVPVNRWTIGGLHPIDTPAPGIPFRMTHDGHPGQRLIVRDQRFIDDLLLRAPRLRGGYTVRHFTQVFGWTAAGLVGVGLLGYVLLSVLPGIVASYLPNSWRERTGKQIEASVVGGAKACSTTAGDAALQKMVANLAQGNDLPPLTVTVYDLPIVNAFAVSGGRVILTRELLETADRPDEIAGVLAHEVGHVFHHHPEEQLLRLTGLQVIMSLFSGSGGGDIATNAAALATLLRYSRGAEEQADSYARTALTNAKIDPLGFKTFFEKMIKLNDKEEKPDENKEGSAILNTLSNIFSTHPNTEERISKITGLPEGVKAEPALQPADWQALKTICKSS